MKILAIRGKNLASLVGEFEVDFRREPLASAGLFAICGPTGAGKSTLLDALCLALYEDTPRLSTAGAKGVEVPDVAGKTMNPRDPCTLVRRGAAEAFAEVEFVGGDGIGYRARWSARRGYGKADRPFQDTQMSLVRLPDGQPIGSRKSEVLPEIERRLGLNFEQFKRAVLLAQNEFAAFLKAGDDERSKLLEALTGTHIYTLISRKAHERDKEEQAKLSEQRARLEGQKPLDDEARKALEAEREAAGIAAARFEAERGCVEGHIRWYAELAAARTGESVALARLREDTGRNEAAEPRRRHLARIVLVQPAAAKLHDFRDAGEKLRDIRAALSAGEGVAAASEQARHSAEEALAQARLATSQALEAQANAAPGLDRAKQLDGEIAGIAESHGERSRELEGARLAHGEAERRQAESVREREAKAADRQAVAAWLDGKKAVMGSLADQWPRWDALLGQAETAERESVAAQTRQAEAATELAKLRIAREGALVARGREERAAARSETEYAEAERISAGFDAAALASERRAAEARSDGLRRAEGIWREFAEVRSRRADLAAKLERLGGDCRAAEAELASIAADKPLAEARRLQAEHSLDAAKLACAGDVEQLRERLEPGQPCPVCGSADHPYAKEAPGLRAVLQALAEAAETHKQAVQALLDREGGRRAALELSTRQAEEIRPALALAAAESVRLEAAWSAEPWVPELAAVAEAERPAWFAAQLSAANEIREAIQAREDAGRLALAARDTAHRKLEAARESWRAAQNREAAAESALARAADALALADSALSQSAQRRDRLLAELAGVLPESGWQENWRRDPGDFHAKLEKRVDIYQSKQRSLDELERRIALLDSEIQSRAAAEQTAAGQFRHAEEVFRQVDKRLREQREERGKLFGGKPAGEVERELRQAMAAAQAREQQAAAVAEQARAQAADARARLDAARNLLDERDKAAERAAAALNTWLAEFNARESSALPLDPAGMTELLDHDPAWIEAEQGDLKDLADAVNHSRAVAEERRQRREEIERRRATEESAEALRERLAALAAESKAADARRVELESRTRGDDERRAKTARLLAEIELLEASARLWGQLNQLIGSYDGKKFRNYAQQVTLDVLLGYANRHLADLSRRYRLERIPDAQAKHTLALMVVDRDMGDEVRSVHSLSGGESFLVSLALALGLAELSSNRVRVESLFIDEGFGSLDTDTLRVAMDALDCLRAQGRKVGVISHVQEMTERIGARIQVKRLAGGRSRVLVG